VRVRRSAGTAAPLPLTPTASAGRPAINPYAGLAVATLAVSFAAIFIHLANAPALTTATYRMAFTVALLAPWLPSRRRALASLAPRDWSLLFVAGILLAVHFATWTVSLFYTSVASSVLFVSVHPVLVAALAWAFFGERPRATVAAGIGLALLGSAIIAGGDLRLGADALLGDGLALAGAAVFAFYLMIGRRVRQRLDPLAYSTPVYAVCAASLAAITLVYRQPFGPLTGRNLLAFVALALVCTLGGHFVYNWALRYVDTAVVSVSFLGEPILSSLLAWPLLGQPVAPLTALGGVIVLAGIYLTARGRSTTHDEG
jgi:drug/metabolite transporter (DMT)-like permease